jgi:hypothetical protein
MTATATEKSTKNGAGPEDVGAPSTGQDYALVGTSSERTLFDPEEYRVEKCEAVLGGITVQVSGQFEDGDEFELRVPVKVVNSQYDSRSKTRRHILHGTEMHRLDPAEVDGEEEGEDK